MLMASLKAFPFLPMLLLLLPTIAFGYGPWPPVDEICKEVECGKGTCVANSSYLFNYICECDAGWRRTVDDDYEDDDDLKYLPCVIPNCTLNYGTCQPAPPPVAEKPVPHNISLFDPCYWIYCGEGTCTKNHTFTRLCTCNAGFYNLLNISYFPCYSECTLGSDCSRLGIKVANQESTPGSSGSGSASADGSHAIPILPGKYQWMIILLMSILMALRN